MGKIKRLMTVGPAIAMTAVSMVLTLAVVVMWLAPHMGDGKAGLLVAIVVGLGLDGGWLATLAYERRLARQGDHSTPVTAVGWAFGAVATGVLVAHALGEDSPGAWLAVSWLPLAAKALWLVHGLWERTALTPVALDRIARIQQEARDDAAVSRAQLRAQAGTEETRLRTVTEVGARVAQVQAQTSARLSEAWKGLETAYQGEDTARALTCVTERVTPDVTPRWELPVWGPTERVPALETAPAPDTPVAPETGPTPTWESETRKAVDWVFNGGDSPMPTRTVGPTGSPLIGMTDAELDAIVADLRNSETPPLSYRELSARFRAAGHSAGETRLRASWRRVTAQAEGA